MSLQFALLDVFANAPFQGTQIPAVMAENRELSDAVKTSVAAEFQQTETVFLETSGSSCNASVFNPRGKTRFGAHTLLAAACLAHERKLAEDCGSYARFRVYQQGDPIECFIDKSTDGCGQIQFARTLKPVVDRFTPPMGRVAELLSLEERHLALSTYHPAVVSVDRPALVVPLTRAEHVLAARLNTALWSELMGDVYASEILLFAPGSVTGSSQFHGRLLGADLPPGACPPIGNVMPEFIAYLAAREDLAEGTHTFAIDRGSRETRTSVLEVEFDKRGGRPLQCRIGGKVVKMASGVLMHP